MASESFDFNKFSANAFYRTLNARLVDMAELGSDQRIVDLACGTGGVTQLILERLRNARNSVIIAVDHSTTALKQAMENLKDAGVQFVQGRVEQLSESVKESADAVFFCNAIHYVRDKDALVAEISKTVKPGGKFAFNTSFFEGGQVPESLAFYRKWMLKASRIARREYGQSLVRPEKVEARRQLTIGEYCELVERNGFKISKQEIDTVQVPIQGWLDISDFEDFITGILPGIPMDQASDALKRGVVQTYDEMGIDYVPRNWLDVVAVRV